MAKKNIIIMTITAGLGDYIIAGNLIKIVEDLSHDSELLIIHKGNSHTNLWPWSNRKEKFFNVFHASDIFRLIWKCRKAKRKNAIIFGLQMAPGSVQGFIFLKVLKLARAVDYIVDFNLINADIITPPKGEYILNLHLNQIKSIINVNLSKGKEKLDLRRTIFFRADSAPKDKQGQLHIGIHPWSRRDHYTNYRWPSEKWIDLVSSMNDDKELKATLKFLILGNEKHKVYQLLSEFKRANINNIEAAICNSVPSLVETINKLDCLISINSGPIHIAYALEIPTVVLNGPALSLWTPKSPRVISVHDTHARFPPNDKPTRDPLFPSISRIEVTQVHKAVAQLLKRSQ